MNPPNLYAVVTAMSFLLSLPLAALVEGPKIGTSFEKAIAAMNGPKVRGGVGIGGEREGGREGRRKGGRGGGTDGGRGKGAERGREGRYLVLVTTFTRGRYILVSCRPFSSRLRDFVFSLL